MPADRLEGGRSSEMLAEEDDDGDDDDSHSLYPTSLLYLIGIEPLLLHITS